MAHEDRTQIWIRDGVVKKSDGQQFSAKRNVIEVVSNPASSRIAYSFRSHPHELSGLCSLYITVKITIAASSTGSRGYIDCAISGPGKPSRIRFLTAPVCRTGAENGIPQGCPGLGDRRALGRVERGRGNSKAVMFDCR